MDLLKDSYSTSHVDTNDAAAVVARRKKKRKKIEDTRSPSAEDESNLNPTELSKEEKSAGRQCLSHADVDTASNSQRPCDAEHQDQLQTTTKPEQHFKRHTFETNVLDHCETPRVAYEHLQSVLEHLAANLNIHPWTHLRLWDPFFCDGSTKRIFREMGFCNIIHENVDFYELIRDEKTIPDHDVLVTNPPYSDNHIDRLLDFVISHQLARHRPTCLLLPNWVSRQQNYSERFTKLVEQAGCELFYLSPVEAYTYTMPSWLSEKDRPAHVGNTGKTTPYLSSWYILVPPSNSSAVNKKVPIKTNKNSIMDRMDALSKIQKPPVWVVAKTVRGLKWKIQKSNQKNGRYHNLNSNKSTLKKRKKER